MREHRPTSADLQSLYAQLQARRGETADRALAWKLGHALRDDAAHLADGIAAARRQRAPRPVFGWALAAAVALVAVFAGRQLAQEGVPAAVAPMEASDLLADGPAPEAPLFSGSFEHGEAGEGVIFDSGFGG